MKPEEDDVGMTVLRWEELCSVPWKNGGGSTRELACAPVGGTSSDFDWRVSVAEVEADGPFSVFPGVDRVIMLIGGPEMHMNVEGEVRRLECLDSLSFPGDAATTCRVPSGATRDLNLMVKRGRAAGSVQVIEVAGSGGVRSIAADDGETVLLLALSNGLAVQAPPDSGTVSLRPLDAAYQAGPISLHITGEGTLAEIRIRMVDKTVVQSTMPTTAAS
jgi:uncharacterized protein